MAAEKIRAVVLRSLAYRESSAVLHLLSREFGLLHCVAKGVRRQGAGLVLLERGVVIEGQVYVRPHRELHTIGGVSIAVLYPGVRGDLLKACLRDAAFEMLLRTVTVSEPHPELYARVERFLDRTESHALVGSHGPLWEFYVDFCALLGFRLNLDTCYCCGAPLAAGGALVNDAGGLVCQRCPAAAGSASHIPQSVVTFLSSPDPDTIPPMTPSENLRISRLLATYCAFHFDVNPQFKSLDFLGSMVA